MLSLLEENGLNDGKSLYILREIQTGGKSLCRVNGTLVSVSFLSNLCRKLADIHGQYDHQSLLDPDSHILLLDNYDHDSIEPLKLSVAQLYDKYSNLQSEVKNIVDAQAESLRNRDFMEYELAEILQAKPVSGEDDELAEQLLMLQNGEFLHSTFTQVYDLLYDSMSSAKDNLSKSMGLLDGVKTFSKEYADFSEGISDCFYKLDDLQADIRNAKDYIFFSQDAIDETIERIDILDRLKKKYGGSIEKVLVYKEKLEEKLSRIFDMDSQLDALTKELTLCESQLKSACSKLTVLRTSAARRMEKDIENELKALNFKDTRLTVSISPAANKDDIRYTASGTDRVEFLIVTNKGEEPKPLNKIASGGEISRIMLAFKSILGGYDNIPTLIFDEIDSGISGVTASIVGRKMRQIAASHQVVCITHLPQIAAFSDHHYKIVKDESNDRTVTTIKPLSHEEKIYEVARLLGGLHITDTVLKNAEELISESSR